MRLRNWCFDHGWLEQRKAEWPVVSVGNLAVGGTGKTPMVELIVEQLRQRGHNPVVVSRGYGRRTKGPLLATAESTADDIGDEPLQIFRHLACPVIVSEDRRKALPLIRQWNKAHPEAPITVIVLDDAYQHRYLQRDCNILLTDYHRLYTRDHVLPFGRLREPACGAKRADVIVVTKCPPHLTAAEAQSIRRELQAEARQQVVFASISYAELPTFDEPPVLLTGIANPAPIREHLQSQGIKIARHLQYADHHRFSANDLAEIRAIQAPIITTAKDATRLPQLSNLHILNIRTHILNL